MTNSTQRGDSGGRRVRAAAVAAATACAVALFPAPVAASPPEAATASAPVPVSVFNYPGLNGGVGALDCGTENSNLISIVDAVGDYEVDGRIVSFGGDAWDGGTTIPRPDGYTVDTFEGLLDESRFFFMTDMERADPTDPAFLPVAARDVLSAWVNSGGVMVMTGTYGSRDTTFLNDVFGWDLTTASGSTWTKDAEGTAGTPFEALDVPSLPNLSATDAIGAGTVADFTPMWGTTDNATVATIPWGNGTVIFLGYDFYNTGAPAPAGGRTDGACSAYSSDWVQNVLPAALAYATALSDSAVTDVSATSATFNYRFAQDGTMHYVVLPADAPAPTAVEIRTGTYTGATPIAGASLAVTAEVGVAVPIEGLAPTTSYRIYALTRYADPDKMGEELDSALVAVDLTTVAAAPTITATPGDSRITISVATGAGPAITNYEYSLDGGATWEARTPASTSSPFVIEGLTNGTAYGLQVRAISVAGPGVASGTVSVTPLPVVIPPKAADPTPVPDTSGKLPDLRPGTATSTIGNEPAEVQVVPFQRPAGGVGLGVTGDSFAVELELSDASGTGPGTGALSGTSMNLVPGGGLKVSMSGFRPGSPALLWIFSEPQLVGEFTTDGTGALDDALGVLPGDLSACQHTIQVVGTLADGRQAAVSLGAWMQPVPYPFSDLSFDTVHGPTVGCLASLDVVHGHGDGTFRPADSITRGQVSSLLARAFGLGGTPAPFADAVDSVHSDAIGAVEAAGIADGFDDGTFRPQDRVSRGQIATFLARAASVDLDAVPVGDVDPADGAHGPAIAALRAIGVIEGYADGTSGASDRVRRDQVASLLSRVLEYLDQAHSAPIGPAQSDA